MHGKDCTIRLFSATRFVVAVIVVSYPVMSVRADAVRVWPTAVVSADRVTISDLCDLSRCGQAVVDSIADVVVSASPKPGGSMVISARDIQASLTRTGANLSLLMIEGAVECKVVRPLSAARRATATGDDDRESSSVRRTLRDAVVAEFQRRLGEHVGRVDLHFTQTGESVLGLSEPTYSFNVTIGGGRVLGRAIRVSVDVTGESSFAGEIALVVDAAVLREVVVARRAINAKAPVRAEAVVVEERSFDRVEDTDMTDLGAVVGQRAKRFIAAGSAISSDDLEMVPLVKQGQIVKLYSVASGIEIQSQAKAMSSGLFGEVVELRIGSRRGGTLSGVVVGEGAVRVGGSDEHSERAEVLALGAGRDG
jgi:flagella basal body P-ring formation protein FlgA